ncbi:HAMP domain-containing sensor histidine kinase [Marinitenerispora sediminis]|uniref:histidine kinase n=1 Tax=Marinitenerispora sediminis TaxID=1931232 RepID=A0A368T9A5_9ACTN|nr:HAMP domain-containing sensor histidine kinase [Marinitenerispora sediminis]RCV54790.1 two-component sensor histidine kinase [Marinitenerispora sediminis]RCV60572.1 two-component sensor histidine kinase [Marinitenerispora sediminis]RCV61038.1 two-component sensor histidine kinase [Marinitenerispora sediminis]
MSLGTRFAVSFALVAAAVIILVGSLAYNAAALLIRTDAQQEFDSTVAGLASDLRSSALGDGGIGQLGLLHSETFTFQLLSPTGNVSVPVNDRNQIEVLPVTPSDRAVAAETAAGVVRTREDHANGETYRIATISYGNGRGAVQIGQRLSPMERMLDSMAWQMVAVGAVVLLCAGGAGWLIARRVTGRLVRLTEAAEYVGSTGRIDVAAPDAGSGSRDEVGRLGRAFDAMLSRLAASKEDQRRLVQNASHELRTPLTSLRTNVSVMKRFDRLSPDAQRRLIDDLQGETRELTDLVNELVELATETREDEAPQEVSLRELARSVAARTGRRTGREIIVDADDSVVFGRPHALERALSNPVENAAKFDTERAGPIEIVIRAGRVEVRDRGPGIDPNELGHIFERFYRATSARSMPGSGLGLSMVHDIATAHGGRVFAGNRPGGGAVIGFELPLAHPGGAHR